MLAGQWQRQPWGAPKMLSRMSLGIVGLGRIGTKVSRIAEAMGMTVNYYDPYQVGGCDDCISLARQSDILTIHAPANTQTTQLVSADVLAALPRGALVINTARGELLDEQALLSLLQSGHLGGAALDTLQGEYQPDFSPELNQHALISYAKQHTNLLLTPHIAGSTVDAWTETERFVIDKAASLLGMEFHEYSN